MARFRTLDDIRVAGRRVLLRADLNVPMAEGRITDATRIERTAPTIAELAAREGRVVVISHLGRPKGRRDPALSLRPVADALAGATGRPVAFVDDCVGPAAEAAVAGLADGEVALLENLRFHAGEEANERAFVVRLAALGDLYVDDAFSCAHRAHASIEGVARLMESAAGRLMEAELEALGRALDDPARPLAAVVGGAKVSTKLDVLVHLAGQVDVLIVGGAMANTFLHARGVDVGRSLCEPEMAETARRVMATATDAGCDIVLPQDVVVAAEPAAGAANRVVGLDGVGADDMILDLGPASAADLEARLGSCATVVWNGPLGAFEVPPFDAATNRVAAAAARLTKDGALLSVAGGGDTVAALTGAGVVDDFSYVSTAGGAFLEWLEGRVLPGVEVLAVGD
jgi:phosphoglycerate kinase